MTGGAEASWNIRVGGPKKPLSGRTQARGRHLAGKMRDARVQETTKRSWLWQREEHNCSRRRMPLMAKCRGDLEGPGRMTLGQHTILRESTTREGLLLLLLLFAG